MSRVYNFSAGPSVLPESVLKKASAEMMNYNNSGQSVMEMSHRSKIYEEIIFGAQDILREIMNIPQNYEVLFLQGGASLQFAMVPLNLMNKNKTADYIITGQWAKKAYAEGLRFGNAKAVSSSEDKMFSYIPKFNKSMLSKDADYLHICLNNTIYGTRFNQLPKTDEVPLIADVSSFILSEPIDVSSFGVLYAGAQKNMGPAGLTVVIIRKDLIGNAQKGTPVMLNYKTYADNNSMYNTPPCYSIYMCKLVLEWIKNEIGGLENMKKLNEEKAGLIYSFLDSSKLFKGTAAKEDHSIMNIPFVTGNKDLDKKFITEAEKNNIINIKGHRSVGGMRASVYNAMPLNGVQALVDFMVKFEKEN
jgi:phosphoserine aminotransferase